MLVPAFIISPKKQLVLGKTSDFVLKLIAWPCNLTLGFGLLSPVHVWVRVRVALCTRVLTRVVAGLIDFDGGGSWRWLVEVTFYIAAVILAFAGMVWL